jgi:hypothetical protein
MGILVLLLAAAAAENDPAAQIRKLAQEGKALDAARLAGAWVADAQKRGDLLDEEAAVNALRSVPLDAAGYRDACAQVMKLLDPKRNGAYLSAHLVALEVLRAAIREETERPRFRAAFDKALSNAWLDLATYAGTGLARFDKATGREGRLLASSFHSWSSDRSPAAVSAASSRYPRVEDRSPARGRRGGRRRRGCGGPRRLSVKK